uniref:Uncharacterized protein n=1 Tax=Anguilla anguilla TaxID=7936 RepID=A0A0E9T1U6_ANGAN
MWAQQVELIAVETSLVVRADSYRDAEDFINTLAIVKKYL